MLKYSRNIARGGKDHPYFAKVRAMLNSFRQPSDNTGIQRHNAGQSNFGLLHYMPQIPSFGLEKVTLKIYTFCDYSDCVSDQIVGNEYKWTELSGGAGTPLAPIDVVGGGGQLTNGALDNNYYTYQSGGEFCQLQTDKDMWFRAKIQISDATQSDFFLGICARIGAGNMFDNRIDAVGFHKEDGDTNIDFEMRNVTGPGDALAQGTLVDATDIILGFRWDSYNQQVNFWIDDVYITRITDPLYIPTTEMCVSFGCRNGEAAAKSMIVKEILVAQEIA